MSPYAYESPDSVTGGEDYDYFDGQGDEYVTSFSASDNLISQQEYFANGASGQMLMNPSGMNSYYSVGTDGVQNAMIRKVSA